MSFHSEELTIPNWLDFQFFENILRSSEGDKTIKVLDTKIVPAATLGDHFASIIYRANINYASKTNGNANKSVIIKTMPVMEGVLKDMLGKSPVFKTEINMYTNILPEMARLLRNVGCKEELAPKMLYSSLEPYQIIVFEDISVNGYLTIKKPLNYDAAKIVATKLAKFHATSYYMNNNNYDLSDYNSGIFNDGSIDPEKAFGENLVLFNEEIIKLLPELEKFSNNIKGFIDICFHKLRKLYCENKGGLNVLNHGDFHYKNLMFTFDEQNEIKEAKFIDFQLSVWASPAIDLTYLLYAISSNETRNDHREELIYFYYQEFVATLKSLGFLGNIPTLLDFNMELLKHGYFEMFMLITIAMFLNIDLTKIDMTKMFEQSPESTIMKRKMFADPNYLDEILKTLPRLVYKGFI